MMDCKQFASLLDTPLESLTQAERESMMQHAAQCRECALMYQIAQDMRAMDEHEPLPQAFSQSWRNAIRQEEERMQQQKDRNRFHWKRALATAAAVVFVAGGTALSTLNGWGLQNSKDTNGTSTAMMRSAANDYEAESAYQEAGGVLYSVSATADGASVSGSVQAAESKIIRTVSFTIRTQQYDAAYAAVERLIAQYGGTTESLSLSGDQASGTLRRANMTLRIPAEQLDAFVGGANQIAGVSSYSETSEDVSENYYDVQSRLQTQQAKMARLLELMEKAESTSDLIELENAISDTQYLIDSYTGSLNGYDSRVNQSYVYVTIRELSNAEAAEEANVSLGERIANAVKASLETAGDVLQGFAVFMVVALPWMLAAGIVAGTIVAIVRKSKKKKGK